MRDQSPAAAIILTCTLRLEAHHLAKRRIAHRLLQTVRAVAEASQVLARQIDPAAPGVLPKIAQYVRELKRDSRILRGRQCLVAVEAPDVDARQADHRRHMPAV